MVIGCPRCGKPLTGGPTCPACGLPVTGPVAAELWTVDQQLAAITAQVSALNAERRRLLDHRGALLQRLAGIAPVPVPFFSGRPAGGGAPAAHGAPTAPPPPPEALPGFAGPAWTAPRARQEWTPKRVQNLLLTLGAVLVVIAAAIFTAVSWHRLSAAVHTVILVALTGLAGWGAVTLARRALTATAEAISGVCLGLAVFDAYAGHELLLTGTSRTTYWTVATALLAVGAAGLGRVSRLRLPGVACAALGLCPLLVQAGARGPASAREALVALDALLAGTALLALRQRSADVPALRRSLLAGFGLLWTVAYLSAGAHILYGLGGQPLGLLVGTMLVNAVAAVVADAAEGDRVRHARAVLSGAAAFAVASAMGLPFEAQLSITWWAPSLVGCALAVLLAAVRLPEDRRPGPVVALAAAAGLAGSSELPSLLDSLGVQIGWAEQAWSTSVTLSRPAGAVLAGVQEWRGPANLLAVALCAVVAVLAGRALGRATAGHWTALALVVLAAVTAVPQLDGPWWVGLLAEVAVTVGLGALAARLDRSQPTAALAAMAAALAVAALALCWALATPAATLLVGALVLAVVLAFLFRRLPGAMLVAAVAPLAAGWTAAGAAGVAGAGRGTVGVAVALVPLLGQLVTARWPRALDETARLAADLGSLVAAVVALLLAAVSGPAEGFAQLLVAAAGLATVARAERRRGLAIAVAVVVATLAAVPYEEQLSALWLPVAETALCLCLLAAGSSWALRSREDEHRESAGVLAGGSLVVAAVAQGAALPDEARRAAVLGLLTAAYALVAAIGDERLAAAGLPRAVRAVATGAASVLALGTAAAVMVAGGGDAAQVALVLGGVAAALGVVATGLARRQPDSLVMEVVAAAVVLPAAAGAAARPVLAGCVLAMAGAAVLVAAGVRPERRRLWPAGAVLCSAATWVWLHVAGVTAPEPYTDPLALVMLWAGMQRRRSDSATTSVTAYGSGLSLLLLPSLAAAVLGDGDARPLALAVLATAVVVAGGRYRLRAPLVLGSVTLLVTALRLLQPVAPLVPRWLEVGSAGALLLVLGATYEQRRRDLSQLRARYDALS